MLTPGPQDIDVFLRAHWQVVPDPESAEFIRTPVHQYRNFRNNGVFEGDCDDAAVMAAYFLMRAGVPSWFVAIRLPHDAEFSHVFVRAFGGSDIDVTTARHLLPIRHFAEAIIVQVWPERDMDQEHYAYSTE